MSYAYLPFPFWDHFLYLFIQVNWCLLDWHENFVHKSHDEIYSQNTALGYRFYYFILTVYTTSASRYNEMWAYEQLLKLLYDIEYEPVRLG
jgi:hypothetical protein